MSNPNAPLVEGIDYYIEAGRWVFTAAYHLKRGYCCTNGCRHCPYGNAPADFGQSNNDRPACIDGANEGDFISRSGQSCSCHDF